MAKREKKYFSNFDAIVDFWALQSKTDARCRNGYFEGDQIYSYGSHYLAARLYTFQGVRVAFVNDRRYSKTTNGHLWSIRGALRRAGIVAFDAKDGVFPDVITAADVEAGLVGMQDGLIDDVMRPFIQGWVWEDARDVQAPAFDVQCDALGFPDLKLSLDAHFRELTAEAVKVHRESDEIRRALYSRTQLKFNGMHPRFIW